MPFCALKDAVTGFGYFQTQGQLVAERICPFPAEFDAVMRKRDFLCTNCLKIISISEKECSERLTIKCPSCATEYKLHPTYVTHKGEIIQYEK